MDAGWKTVAREQKKIIRTEMSGKCAEGFAGDEKIRRWRKKAVSREEWASVIKEGGALRMS